MRPGNGCPRGGRARPVALVLTAAALAALVTPAAAGAASAPALSSATFSVPAGESRATQLTLRASDRERAVSGVVVAFEGEGSFASSACRPRDSSGRVPGTAFRAATPVELAVPHAFAGTDPRAMLVRLDAQGCSGGGGVLYAPFTVTPAARDGDAPRLVAGTPVAILGTLPAPHGAGPGSAPATPVLPTVPDFPDIPALPAIPTVAVPPVGPLPPLPGVTPIIPVDPPQLPELRAVAAARRTTCRDAAITPTRRTARRAAAATLCLVNLLRRAKGLRALRADRRMAAAARAHSADMVRRGYFAHVDPAGRDVIARLRATRWLPRAPYWLASENIAAGSGVGATPQDTVQSWYFSSAHRENMLDPSFNVAGIGVTPGMPGAQGPGAATYTNDFGHVAKRARR